MTVVRNSVPFGKKFREEYYPFELGVTPLNNGSFGNAPKAIHEKRMQYVSKVAEFPDQFFKRSLFDELAVSRKNVADILDADFDNVVFVSNATTALNTILRSYPLVKGDKIITCSTIYGACRHTMKFLQARLGIEVIELKLVYPLTHDDIVAKFVKAMEEHEPKMVFFDTVSSFPAYVMPWERLTQECKTHGALSVIDGAHGIGLVPISLNKTSPDFFTTNLHKWFMAPNSCAVLYVDKQHHPVIHSLPVSNTYYEDDADIPVNVRFSNTFAEIGTLDYTPYLTISDIIMFRKNECGGEEAIQAYCKNLAKITGEMVAEAIGGEVLGTVIPISLINVSLPLEIKEENFEDFKSFAEDYMFQRRTFIPMGWHGGKPYTRWSAQVYVDLDDVKFGITVLKNILDLWNQAHP